MRNKILLNSDWLFNKDCVDINKIDASLFSSVVLPHTWNALDGQDGGGDYLRTKATYLKYLAIAEEDLTKDLYLEFEGVFNITEVYINKKKAFTHKGGFQTFRVYLNEYIHLDNNEIVVYVDNKPNKETYPQFADFTFFGGIYRDVSIIKVNKTHFDLNYYGTNGVKALIKKENDKWNIYLTSFIDNFLSNYEVEYSLIDDTKVIRSIKVDNPDKENILEIDSPRLWNGFIDPYLYKLRARILEKEEVIDEVKFNVGFRTFYVDSKKGFFLNDKSYPLHGVSRHQDRLNKGWAISKEDHEEDIKLIKEVGANTIRLAHYQHAQYFYDLCDKYGFIIWAEIPYISMHMDEAKENAFSQMKELVLQNYNHPSIMFIGLSNEITMRGESPKLIEDHKELNALVHRLDPTRLTTLALVSMNKIDSEMCRITDVISYNHYFGWYAGKVEDNGPWIDNFHLKYPDIPLGISEYGAEGILKWHSTYPTQGDYSEEYQAYYHEKMLETFATRPYLWSTHVWNMFDFGADNRDEGGVKGRNNKGLVTYDRKTKKDSFYIYKAYWNNEDKFIHITSKRFINRSQEEIEVKIYTNLDEVSLYQEEKFIDTKRVDNHIVRFKVKLHEGENKLIAKEEQYKDEATFIKVDKEDASYQLDDNDGVTNWFDKDGNPVDFSYPEGYLNINSTINEVKMVPLGKALIDFGIKFAMKKLGMGDGGSNEDLLNMVGEMSIKRILKFAGSKIVTKDVLYSLNEILNKIPLETKETQSIYKSFVFNYKDEKLILKKRANFFNINAKVKDLLNNEIVNGVFNLLMNLKKDGKKMVNISWLKLALLKHLRVGTLLKLAKNLPASYIYDINDILLELHK